ncbi:MAG: PP2C family protein-serine/threonine phosphatase [Calditrichaceae bacterium]
MFRVHTRFIQFTANLKQEKNHAYRWLFFISGWIISFYILTGSFADSSDLWPLTLLIHVYFWYHLNKKIIVKFHPPVEFLLIMILFLYGIEYLLLNTVTAVSGLSAHFSGLQIFLQKFVLAFIVLFFGLLIVENTRKNEREIEKDDLQESKFSGIKQGILIGYFFLGLLAHSVVFYDHIYYLYLFQFLLFAVLLKRTVWLESLTKIELWIYFLIFVILFIVFMDDSIYRRLKPEIVTNKVMFFSIPYYLYLLIKIYLLALIIKIPVVLVYNHAGLSRKLQISGLFQSTFPQLIQMVTLLTLFYFFISGWQAQNLRKTIHHEMGQIASGKKVSGHDYPVYSFPRIPSSISLKGYQPRPFYVGNPDTGILAFTPVDTSGRGDDYFLYFASSDTFSASFHLVKLDTAFIKRISEHISLFAGTGILAYVYKPNLFRETLYKFDFWQGDHEIKIFPFGILSNNLNQATWSEIDENDRDYETNALAFHENYFPRHFIIGELFLPVIGSDNEQSAYFAFDIYLSVMDSRIGKVMVRIILLLFGIYLLFNSFITRRVIKFGSEINGIIVRKFDQLKTGIREISSGNLDYKVILEGEDEFVELADRFNRMGSRLKETIEAAREKDRLDQELKIARDVQLSLLPKSLPDVQGYKIVADLKTATEVGGDFYDLLSLDENHFLFAIGDVSGKGSSAAFYMAQFMSLLRYSAQFTVKPAEIAQRLNEYFANHINDKQIFVTAIIGLIDLEKQTLSFIRAGHTKPYLVPADAAGMIAEIDQPGLGIGLTNSKQIFKKSLRTVEISLQTDDMLVLYTDGVVEAARPAETSDDEADTLTYGDERFRKNLEGLRGADANKVLRKIKDELDGFYGENLRVDDHTIMIIQKN